MVEPTDKSLKGAVNRECLEEIGVSFDSSLFQLISENIIVKCQQPKTYLTFYTEIFEERLFTNGAEIEEIKLSLFSPSS